MPLVIFRLTQKTPTGYKRQDGTVLDQPLTKRIVPEYTFTDPKTKAPIKYRHIRNEATLVKNQQSSSFTYADNLFFTNGFMVLDEDSDKISIEFVRNHPENADFTGIVKPNVIKKFEEVKEHEASKSEVSMYKVLYEAQKLVHESSLENGDFDCLCYVNGVSTLDYSTAMHELLKIASSAPIDFVEKSEQGVKAFKNQVDSLLANNKVKVDNEKLTVDGTEIVSSPGNQKVDLYKFFSSPVGIEKFKKLSI